MSFLKFLGSTYCQEIGGNIFEERGKEWESQTKEREETEERRRELKEIDNSLCLGFGENEIVHDLRL